MSIIREVESFEKIENTAGDQFGANFSERPDDENQNFRFGRLI